MRKLFPWLMCLVLVLARVGWGQAGPTPGGNEPTPAGAPFVMTLTVVEAGSGQPLEGVDVSAKAYQKPDVITRTDAQGQALLQWPAKPAESLDIIVRHPGHVSLRAEWEAKSEASIVPPVPDQLQLEMVPGQMLRGQVCDPQGRPVANAKVRIVAGAYAFQRPAIDSFVKADLTTDAQGYWQMREAPADMEQYLLSRHRLEIEVLHPDYQPSPAGLGKGDLETMRRGEHRITLQPGITLTGTVVDAQGAPVEGVLVQRNRHQRDHAYYQTRTDAKGHFALPGCAPGQEVVGLIKEGYAPRMLKLAVSDGMAPLAVTLEPGRVLKLRAVDGKGQPMQEAWVGLNEWERTMWLNDHIDGKTNAEGRWQWTWAPAEMVELRVGKKGYVAASLNQAGDGQEHVVTLVQPLVIQGKVTDAQTGLPIPRFSMIPVQDENGRRDLFVDRRNAQPMEGGEYRMRFTRGEIHHAVRLEAPGYLPYITPTHSIQDGVVDEPVALEPCPMLEGRVVDAQGRPVAGADVRIATAANQLQRMDMRGVDAFCSGLTLTSDAEGKFQAVAQEAPYAVVVTHDSGYGIVQRDAKTPAGEVKLSPWAQVEGVLYTGGKPAAGEYIAVEFMRPREQGLEPVLRERVFVVTDAQGKFTMDRVPPLAVNISALLGPWDNSPLSSSPSIPMILSPGQKVHLELNGRGATVVGRVVGEGQGIELKDYHFALCRLVKHGPGIDPPAWLDIPALKQARGWSEDFTGTADGADFLDTRFWWFVKMTPEGTFRIEGLEAGTYDLNIRLFDDPHGGCLTKPLAVHTMTITVPEGEAPVVDLGVLRLALTSPVQLGDELPDIEFTTLESGKGRLSDYRGKTVVLDVWATWCRPCIVQHPALAELAKKHAAHNVVVLGLAQDQEKDTWKRYLEQHPLPWTQGFLGEGPDEAISRKLGASSTPCLMLVDVQGKLVMKTWKMEELQEALAKHLAK